MPDVPPTPDEYVAAFENDDPRYWSALLRQVNTIWDPNARRMTFDDAALPNLLRGYKWLRPVPWAEPWEEDPERGETRALHSSGDISERGGQDV